MVNEAQQDTHGTQEKSVCLDVFLFGFISVDDSDWPRQTELLLLLLLLLLIYIISIAIEKNGRSNARECKTRQITDHACASIDENRMNRMMQHDECVICALRTGWWIYDHNAIGVCMNWICPPSALSLSPSSRANELSYFFARLLLNLAIIWNVKLSQTLFPKFSWKHKTKWTARARERAGNRTAMNRLRSQINYGPWVRSFFPFFHLLLEELVLLNECGFNEIVAENPRKKHAAAVNKQWMENETKWTKLTTSPPSKL